MRSLTTTVLASALVLVLAAPATAEVIWDGSGDPVSAGFGYLGIPIDDVAPDPYTFDTESGLPKPGIMYQDTRPWTGASGTYAVYNLPAATAATELVRANGWFVETRIEVLENGNTHGLYISVRDDGGGFTLALYPTAIHVFDGDISTWPNPLVVIPIGLGYHTIRMEVAPNGSTGDVYVDNATTPNATIDVNGIAVTNMSWGDAGSKSHVGEANWDYMVVNAEIPEPSSLTLLATGLVGLLAYAWRKRK